MDIWYVILIVIFVLLIIFYVDVHKWIKQLLEEAKITNEFLSEIIGYIRFEEQEKLNDSKRRKEHDEL